MDSSFYMSFKVTPSQRETIEMRMSENGFDDISSYLKVVALNIQTFSLTSVGSSTEESFVELGFNVTQSQKAKIEENMKENGCDDLTTYLRYVALHAVVTAVVEVRSAGNLDSMLARIAKAKKRD